MKHYDHAHETVNEARDCEAQMRARAAGQPTYRDTRGVVWHTYCTCNGEIGAPCPVCNPPKTIMEALSSLLEPPAEES